MLNKQTKTIFEIFIHYFPMLAVSGLNTFYFKVPSCTQTVLKPYTRLEVVEGTDFLE